MLRTEIEIARAPEEVRKVFLDFPHLPEWSHGFIKSITPAQPGAIQPGDKLKCELQGMTINTTVMENSALQFKWRGRLWGLPGLFVGDHCFRFEPSKVTPGSTTFVHAEEFSGILAFTMAGGPFAKQTRMGFEGFNGDLKTKLESLN